MSCRSPAELAGPSFCGWDAKIEPCCNFQVQGKRFGMKLLYEDVNWLITPGERSGLVGGNGTGKSTLLKVLAGTESLDLRDDDQAEGYDDRIPAAGWVADARQDGVRGMPERV